jgi:hypothetical protein
MTDEDLKIGARVMLKVSRGPKRGQTLIGTIDGMGPQFVGIEWDDGQGELYTRAEVKDEFELYAGKRQQ